MAEEMTLQTKFISVVSFFTILFFLFVAFDITPYVRGPAPYPPEWRWDYLFVNTFSKVWLPIIVFGLILFLYQFTYKLEEKKFKKKELYYLSIFTILFFFFQLSVLFFSRSGVSVLIHRIINPDLNGYFTAATHIHDVSIFLKNYDSNVLSLPQHAQGHPPGAIFFFYTIQKFLSLIPWFDTWINEFIPKHEDIKLIWLALSQGEKTAAIFSAFFIPFLSSITGVVIYFISKTLSNAKTGLLALLLFIFVPSVTLFTPLNDVFLPFFSSLSFLLFMLGLIKKNYLYLLFSGFLFLIGLLFSISLLPLLLIFGISGAYAVYRKNKLNKVIVFSFIFGLGALAIPVLLYVFYGFNFLKVSLTLMKGLPESRSYFTWLFYNLYDFFIFLGIPIFISVIYFTYTFIYKKIVVNNNTLLLLGFLIMLFILDFLGSVRGEVGRIWLPFVPFPIIGISYFLKNHVKLSEKYLVIFLLLQATQIIIMQEFWVTLW